MRTKPRSWFKHGWVRPKIKISWPNMIIRNSGNLLKMLQNLASLHSSRSLTVQLKLRKSQTERELVHFVTVEHPWTTCVPQITQPVSKEELLPIHLVLELLVHKIYGDLIMLSKEMHPEKENSQPMQTGTEEAIMQLKAHQFALALHLQDIPCMVHHLTLLLMLPDSLQLSVTMNSIVSSANRESI